MSNYTTRNLMILQLTGENINTWGTALNNSMISIADEALDGVFSVTITGLTAITLSIVNGTASVASAGATQQVARSRVLLIQGVRSTTHTITVPQAQKHWIIIDQTTGAGTVTVTAAGAGTTANAVQLRRTIMLCDGTASFNITSTEPRLDQIDAPTAAVSFNGQKGTGLGLATVSTDAASLANAISSFAAATANVSMGAFQILNLGTGNSGTAAVNVTQLTAAIAAANIPASAGTVLISASDTTAGYVFNKFIAGSGTLITRNNPGANESLTWAPDFTVVQAAINPGNVPVAVQFALGGIRGPIQIERGIRNARYLQAINLSR